MQFPTYYWEACKDDIPHIYYYLVVKHEYHNVLNTGKSWIHYLLDMLHFLKISE